jgi:hypothetical protein
MLKPAPYRVEPLTVATADRSPRPPSRVRYGAAVFAGLAAISAVLVGVMWLVHLAEGLPPDVPRREMYDDGNPDPGSSARP